MFCGGNQRGKKRKSYDMYQEDRENLLDTASGDYVCMTGNRLPTKAPRYTESHHSNDCYVSNDPGDPEYTGIISATEQKAIKQGLLKGKGQLHVAIYVNCGLLTVHVIQASRLSREKEEGCCAYVKVCLCPDHSRRTRCRTSTAARSCNPVFDEKFSFELLEEDLKKRILISVWHRERANEHSQCLGCMSFGIQHITSQRKTVDGWYYLLSEDIGKRKHLQVSARMRFSSPVRPDHHGYHGPCSTPIHDPHMLSPVRGGADGYHRDDSYPLHTSSTPIPSRCPLPHTPTKYNNHHGNKPKEPVYTELTVVAASPGATTATTTTTTSSNDTTTESHVFVIKRGDVGYGFSVTGSCPVKVTRVDQGTPAESVGLQRDDLIVRLNGVNMSRSNADSVARVIKSSEKKIILEIERPIRVGPPGQEDTPQFSDQHPVVSTPEYTPLIYRHPPEPSRRADPSASTTPPPQGRKGRARVARGAVRSLGMCGGVRRVRFTDDQV